MKYQVVTGYKEIQFESENANFSEVVVVWAEGQQVAIKGFESDEGAKAKAYAYRQLKKYDAKGIGASAGRYVVFGIKDEVAEAKKFFDDHFKIIVVS